MGSCFSRKKKKTPSSETAYFHQKSPHAESHTLLLPNPINAFPPPPPLQEETVKEVLQLSVFPKPETKEKHEKEEEEEDIEVSEYFEIGSLKETVSTVMITERKEEDNGCDEIEMLQKKKKKRSSPAKSRRKMSASGGFQEMVERGLRSPARSSDPLSEPRTSALEWGRSSQGLSPAGNSGFRRDRGEVSGRSSRSQAYWIEVDRSPSGRKTRRYPIGAPAEEMEDGGWKVEEGGGAPPTLWESIEKPLISLECFIFL